MYICTQDFCVTGTIYLYILYTIYILSFFLEFFTCITKSLPFLSIMQSVLYELIVSKYHSMFCVVFCRTWFILH